MTHEFTRYQLRKRLEDVGIEVNYGQFNTYITQGLLPDPDEEPWVEAQIMPRMLRIRELDETAWSLDRRVVVLYTEGYAVPPSKLRDAMVGMLPSITEKPVRKLNRVVAAGRWFTDQAGDGSTINAGMALPSDWRPPARADWATVLAEVNLEVFAHRLGIVPYYLSLLATLGKGTPHDLSDMDPAERLVLLMIEYCAAWHWFQAHGQERS